MIAINDNYADGRDMSWLWTEFGSLREDGVKSVAGIRAYDMALRLQYDKVAFDDVNTDIKQALKYFIKSNDGKPKRIYCSQHSHAANPQIIVQNHQSRGSVMSEKTLNILHIYPRDMNIYGDYGNVLVLARRAQWHGYTPKIMHYNPGSAFPKTST